MPFLVTELDQLNPEDLKQGNEVNIICGTPIDDLIMPLFGPLREDVEDESILLAPEDITWPRLLAKLQCFPSASQAAKNWKAQKKDLEITPGFNGPLSIGKARRIHIWVWKVIPE